MPALRAVLTSAEAKPAICQLALPPGTGESSVFSLMLAQLHAAYGRGDLFKLSTLTQG